MFEQSELGPPKPIDFPKKQNKKKQTKTKKRKRSEKSGLPKSILSASALRL
jgi:hypothetical protein